MLALITLLVKFSHLLSPVDSLPGDVIQRQDLKCHQYVSVFSIYIFAPDFSLNSKLAQLHLDI